MKNKRKNIKRVLVTGGNGFIGGHVLDYLVDLGIEAVSFDRFGIPHRKDVEFVQGDVRDLESITNAAKKCQGIVNLAAILGTSETVNNPRGTVSSNLHGAVNVFDCAKNLGVSVCHITVGNFWMNNPYAITKNAAERLALLYNRTHGTNISIVRGLNAYGDRQKATPVRKIMPNFVIPALNKSEIVIYGTGAQKMDMIHVKDVPKVLVEALVQEHGAWDAIFEAGSGLGPTVKEICNMVIKAAGPGAKVTHLEMRPGEPVDSAVIGSPETLKPLGLTTNDFIDLDKGIQSTVEFYRANLDKYSENFIYR